MQNILGQKIEISFRLVNDKIGIWKPLSIVGFQTN